VPEGFYIVDRFNPASNFHLSLGINYPNHSDRILKDRPDAGGDIFIHGNCVTIGCVPITDEMIKELYVMAVEARDNGQARIPVHIFPCRMDAEGMARLQEEFNESPRLIRFWENIKMGYDLFESSRKLPEIRIGGQGKYHVSK